MIVGPLSSRTVTGSAPAFGMQFTVIVTVAGVAVVGALVDAHT